MNFADKLKAIRKREGLSQEDLAEKIGVSRQAVTKWETGRGMPDIENILILAEIFKTSIDDLISASSDIEKEKSEFTSETIYDIDSAKNFDINIGSAGFLEVGPSNDQKFYLYLISEELENISELFKVKLDESKNKLDIDIKQLPDLSNYQALEQLKVKILLPQDLCDEVEIKADLKKLEIANLKIKRLEYDGRADYLKIKNFEGSLELSSKNDYLIEYENLKGILEIQQFKASSVIIPDRWNFQIEKRAKKSKLICEDKYGNFKNIADLQNDNELLIRLEGIFAELIIKEKD